MELLSFNQNTWKIELNKPWLMMVPEFKALIDRDKGSPGDYRGQYKLRATDEFSYIYLMLDWKSPLRNYEPEKLEPEAFRVFERLKYTPQQVAEDVELQAAMAKYKEMLYRVSRSLKTLHVVKNSLDELDNYFEDLDFSKEDKQGKPFYTMKEYQENVKRLKETYDSIDDFEERVSRDLADQGSIASRNKALSILEKEYAFEKKRKQFKEAGPVQLTEEDLKILEARAKNRGETDEEEFEPENDSMVDIEGVDDTINEEEG